jgi:HAD superfamily hydrolase (TIGR01509 family)
VDSEPIASRVLAEVLTDFGFATSSREAIDRYTGISLKAVFAKIEAEWGRPLPTDFAATLRRRDIAAFQAELQPMPGVPETLEALDRLNIAKCVASSGTLAKLRVTLGVTNLHRCFEPHIFSAEMVERGKPAPDLFLYAARCMGVSSDACVVIEDSVPGIQAAQAAGMRSFGFIGGGHVPPDHAATLSKAGATLVFAQMTDLPSLLARPTG